MDLSEAAPGFELAEGVLMMSVTSLAGRDSIGDGCELRLFMSGPPGCTFADLNFTLGRMFVNSTKVGGVGVCFRFSLFEGELHGNILGFVGCEKLGHTPRIGFQISRQKL